MKYSYTTQAANEYAQMVSKSVVIRSYQNGSSVDERRNATPYEAAQVEKAIIAALYAILDGHDVESAKATAEYFIIHGSRKDYRINTYDSVYIPINEFLKANAIPA